MTEEELHYSAVNSYRNRSWNLACLEFMQLLYINPQNVNYQHNMAMVLQYGFSNYDGAEKYFKQSVRASQNSHVDILRHYCQLLSIIKRYEDCKNYYALLFRVIHENNKRVLVDMEMEKNNANNPQQQQTQSQQENQSQSQMQTQTQTQTQTQKQENESRSEIKLQWLEITYTDHLNYAEALLECGVDFEQSELHFKKALEMRPDNPKILLKYGLLLSRDRRFQEAHLVFSTALKLSPNDMDLKYELATVLWNKQEYEEAILTLKQCLLLATTLSTTGQSAEMASKCKEFQEKCVLLYGIMLEEKQEYDKAEKYIAHAIALNQPNLKSLADLSYHDKYGNKAVDVRYLAEFMLIKIRKDEFDHAFRMYRFGKWMCAYGSNSGTATNNTGNGNGDGNGGNTGNSGSGHHYEEILNRMERVRNSPKKKPSILYQYDDEDDQACSDWYLACIYAVYCSKTNAIAKATRLFKKLINSDENKAAPCYFIHYYYALHLHYVCKDYPKAKTQYFASIKIENNWAITHFHLALCLFELGEYQNAKNFALQAQTMNRALPLIDQRVDKFVVDCDAMIAQVYLFIFTCFVFAKDKQIK
ncbi:TPR repeat-containing protein [Reticulomyxa filosa]|uniref:TPR repeat-containing protein n=1 Tax=Reticulomyxa filosa TaxID=46433 RepID=X6M8A3_RETFI|nr:TPR repeat-containing protein [Reticulomyxa filosa]|eukprot:ETO10144.1 TPR repeat-containing protein [Reticulomyxa filosa]